MNDVEHRCGDCRRVVRDDENLTEINPPGGYGRPQLLVCDDCMRSGRWDDWKRRKWPNWPEAVDKKEIETYFSEMTAKAKRNLETKLFDD